MLSTIFKKDHALNGIFDTLQFAKRALAAGFTQKQAEFQAEEIANLLDDALVTKTTLKQELSNSEHRMQTYHNRLSWQMLGAAATLITISQAVFHFIK